MTNANRISRRQKVLAVAAWAAAIVGARFASANESTWTGGGLIGGVTLWTAPPNWSNNVIPAVGADIKFVNSFASGTTINAAGNRSVGMISLDTATSFTLANFGGVGNLITLSSGDITRTATSTGTQVISSPLALTSAAVWTLNGAGGVEVAADLTSNNGSGLQKLGSASLTFSHSASVITGSLNLAAGTTILRDASDLTVQTPAVLTPITVTGAAVFTVMGGSKLRSLNTSVVNSGGQMFVEGAGSEWLHTDPMQLSTRSTDIVVGGVGLGSLTVSTGAKVTTTELIQLGELDGSYGVMNIQSGGAVYSKYAGLAYDSHSRGVANVTDANSFWNITKDLEIGESADSIGSLGISNGAKVQVGRFARINTADSRVQVNNGTLSVGGLVSDAGVGSITLTGNGSVSNTGALVVLGTADDSTFGGNIGGWGRVYKYGTFSQTLSGSLTYTGSTSVVNGTLAIPGGINSGTVGAVDVASPGTLKVGGLVNAAVTGTGTIQATSALTLGNPLQDDAVTFSGLLDVGAQTVTLRSQDSSLLSGTVHFANGGKLTSTVRATIPNTVSVDAGASATIAVDADYYNGVNGPTAAGKSLTFTGLVEGFPNFSGNISFAGRFNPGFVGPSTISAENVTFDSTATYIASVLPHTDAQFQDKLLASGAVKLGGTLDVLLSGNRSPVQGDSFTIVSTPGIGGSISGKFAAVTHQKFNDTTWFAVIYSPTAVRLAVAAPGDATLDGTINISDFAVLAANFNRTGLDWRSANFNGDNVVNISDFALLVSHFNQSAAALPRGARVPEPCGVMTIGTAALLRRRRRAI